MKNGNMLITGGAGFVGSNLAVALKQRYPDAPVIALDNLRRRGAELNLPRLQEAGVEFIHGDVRNPGDLELDQQIGVLIECSAEPSVLAGYGGSPRYTRDANLVGALHCLEAARRCQADVIFLSTSRVYPYQTLNSLNFQETELRWDLEDDQPVAGASSRGISEDFPLEGLRSLYGATKLAAELVFAEYTAMYGMNIIINRCGVIGGPWQMGKVDQGVFTLWTARHYFKRPLKYIGFGGQGKQVRDLLDIRDLVRLIDLQLNHPEKYSGRIYNVGGGRSNSLSLQETTQICREITGNRIEITPEPPERPADIKYYVSDNSRIRNECGWQPAYTARETLASIYEWIKNNEAALKTVLE